MHECPVDSVRNSKAQRSVCMKGVGLLYLLRSFAHCFSCVLPDIPLQMPFYRCRIPMNSCDVISTLPSRGSPESRNIILMFRDWCYAIDVLDDTDTPAPAIKIESYIWEAIHDANLRHQRGESAVPVGVLTAHDRNSWAKVSGWTLLCNTSH